MILSLEPPPVAVCPACRVPNPNGGGPCPRCGLTWSQAVLGLGPRTATLPPADGVADEPPTSETSRADTPTPAIEAVGPPVPRRPNSTVEGLFADLAAVAEPMHTLAATPAAPVGSGPAPVPPPPAPPRLKVRLVVLRGQRVGVEYPVYEGRNTIGRFADRPVDIDLMTQEAVEQIWCSRQHAVFLFDGQTVAVEDLNSLNGTWVNGKRLAGGVQHVLKPNDVVQVGTVQMRVLVD